VKIVVAVKQVADLDDLDGEPVRKRINEWDLFALQAALDLDGEVVAVTVGDEGTDEVLLQCLARGAQRAVRIDDAGLPADPLVAARLVAAFAEREAPDLILCGTQSSDAANGAVPAAVAGLLDMARVAVVRGLRLAGERMELDRELEGGLVEQVSVALPAVVSVQTGINQPRQPNLRALKRADKTPREELSPEDLGLDPAELESAAGARTRGLVRPGAGESRATMLDGNAAEVAERIWEIIGAQVPA
jgi:electron transfer flavoprotein beta subunit